MALNSSPSDSRENSWAGTLIGAPSPTCAGRSAIVRKPRVCTSLTPSLLSCPLRRRSQHDLFSGAPRRPMKVFPPFRLDTVNQCLWRRGDPGQEARILLTPKPFAILEYLVEHAGRLVTHDELLEAVWPDTVVEPQAVKKHVLGVRAALGDRARNSLFIETIPTRGYRFIAGGTESIATSPTVSGTAAPGDLVGRGGALEALRETWQHALSGERQIVFVTGEPGIGKTALAEEFQRRVAVSGQFIRIAHGQCSEGYGSKEAYGPMLDARGQVCPGPQAEPIIQILSTDAPTWLVQLPALLT